MSSQLLTRWLMSEWNLKTSLLKISKIKYTTLLSDANVPVRFRAQRRVKPANRSPRSTVSQLKCVSDTISSWFENHQPQKTKIPAVYYAPFIQNSNQMASRLTVTASFPRVFFSTPVIFKAMSKLFGSQGCSDDKKWLVFSSIFFKICTFRSSILLSL